MKYQTRLLEEPMEVEAVRYRGGFWLAWLQPNESVHASGLGDGACVVETSRGAIGVAKGDWIVRASDGSVVAMPDAIFKAAFDKL